MALNLIRVYSWGATPSPVALIRWVRRGGGGEGGEGEGGRSCAISRAQCDRSPGNHRPTLN